MKKPIKLTLVFLTLTASLAADVIQKSGVYNPKGGSTTLRISDSETAVAKFEHVTPDGRKTQSEAVLGEAGTWACFLEGEWTVWIYEKGKDSIRAITILPPENGKLEFRTSIRRVSISEETQSIPAELRSVIK
jgi:hypothetical protein